MWRNKWIKKIEAPHECRVPRVRYGSKKITRGSLWQCKCGMIWTFAANYTDRTRWSTDSRNS